MLAGVCLAQTAINFGNSNRHCPLGTCCLAGHSLFLGKRRQKASAQVNSRSSEQCRCGLKGSHQPCFFRPRESVMLSSGSTPTEMFETHLIPTDTQSALFTYRHYFLTCFLLAGVVPTTALCLSLLSHFRKQFLMRSTQFSVAGIRLFSWVDPENSAV